MKKIYFLIFTLLISNMSFSQDFKLIKSEKKDNLLWNYYEENDSTIIVKILNKKGKTSEIRRYSDTSLTTETGEWISYFSNGNISNLRFFEDGYPTGTWIEYYKNGEIAYKRDYNFSISYINKDTIDKTPTIKDPYVNEILPKFKGGPNEFTQFIISQLSPLDLYLIEKNANLGRLEIFVQFDVNIDGKITDIKVHNYNKKILEKDAVRAIRNSPNWIPGYSDNKPTKVIMTIPIIYTIE